MLFSLSFKVEHDKEALLTSSDLLPPVEISGQSKIRAPSLSPAPEFNEWQKREKKHYSELSKPLSKVGSRRAPEGVGSFIRFVINLKVSITLIWLPC